MCALLYTGQVLQPVIRTSHSNQSPKTVHSNQIIRTSIPPGGSQNMRGDGARFERTVRVTGSNDLFEELVRMTGWSWICVKLAALARCALCINLFGTVATVGRVTHTGACAHGQCTPLAALRRCTKKCLMPSPVARVMHAGVCAQCITAVSYIFADGVKLAALTRCTKKLHRTVAAAGRVTYIGACAHGQCTSPRAWVAYISTNPNWESNIRS